mgnify:FL=1
MFDLNSDFKQEKKIFYNPGRNFKMEGMASRHVPS